jgi:aromatic ring-opening dioxygenase LigB subunit
VPGAPQKFDDLIYENLDKFDPENILYVDEDLQETAGECGYRSLLILLGAIDGLQPKPEVISYEHPFGVGYLVADFRIKE